MNRPRAWRARRASNSQATVAVAALLALAACANPMPPTGGPADEVPPEVRVAVPADQSVSVNASEMTIEFTEYVDEASFLRALSITPAFTEQPDVVWRGRTATIRFPEPLRANTTYIIQIDNNLRDVHGVSLARPITLAFATGPRIDQGRIQGRVVEAERGSPVAGIDVYAYRTVEPETLRALPNPPDYRTQTGIDGTFEFRHLPEGVAYYVVALADANRNRTPEQTEAFAAPPIASVRADTVSSDAPARPWITTRVDTVAPVAQRARAITSRRVEVRFSEPVRLADTLASWVIRSADGGPERQALPYVTSDARVVVAMVDSLATGGFEVMVTGLVDSVGNPSLPAPVAFDAITLADTARVRFVEFGPDTSVSATPAPGAFPEITFTSGMSAAELRPLLSVTDTLGMSVPYRLATDTRTTWTIESPAFEERGMLVISVSDPTGADTVYARRFSALSEDGMGEISGVVSPVSGRVVVEIHGAGSDDPRRVSANAQGRFLADRLPAGAYFLRAYTDVDSSDTWTGGLLAPYRPPEPMTWLPDSVRVRARWETALEDTLFLPTGL
ncbi:MAG TPA: Ig-like domain-containing domain [Rhodothermales bacterium]